jgi:hypothetical protein
VGRGAQTSQGVASSNVTVVLSNGPFTFQSESPTCTVLDPGALVRCSAPPGVGYGHGVVVVVVDGVSSGVFPNRRTLAYEPPSVLSITTDLAELPTAGGVPVVIVGSNFGPVALGPRALGDVSYVAVAWVCFEARVRITGVGSHGHAAHWHFALLCFARVRHGTTVVLCTGSAWRRHSPVYLTLALGWPVIFHAHHCAVTRDHVELQCSLGPGVGVRSQWTVTIANQSSSNPQSSYRRPVVASLGLVVDNGSLVYAPDPRLLALTTTGGQTLVFRGESFGPRQPRLPVTAVGRRVAAGTETGAGAAPVLVVTTSDCEVADDTHTEVRCRTPPGSGAGYTWTLSVAGQSSLPSLFTTSYAAPMVSSVALSGEGLFVDDPLGLPTAGRALVTVSGRNFGSSAGSVVVTWGGVQVAGVVVLSVPHTTITFPSPPGQGVASLVVVVGGQGSTSVVSMR